MTIAESDNSDEEDEEDEGRKEANGRKQRGKSVWDSSSVTY